MIPQTVHDLIAKCLVCGGKSLAEYGNDSRTACISLASVTKRMQRYTSVFMQGPLCQHNLSKRITNFHNTGKNAVTYINIQYDNIINLMTASATAIYSRKHFQTRCGIHEMQLIHCKFSSKSLYR